MKTSNTLTPAAINKALGTDFELCWGEYERDDPSHVTDEGHLVLELKDLFDPNGFRHWTLVHEWAAVVGFEFQGLDPNEVFACILGQSLYPAVRERHDGHRLRNQQEAYLRTGIAPTDIPVFRIAVHGGLLLAAIVRVLDGPFTSEHETRLAIARRCRFISNDPADWVPDED